MLKFASFAFLEIVNQSIMVKIPQHPQVSSFRMPMPVSPSIKRSIPRAPKKIETKRMVVGSFISMVEIRENFSSSMVRSLSFRDTIFSSGKNYWFVMIYISILF